MSENAAAGADGAHAARALRHAGGHQLIPRPPDSRSGPRPSWWDKPVLDLSGIRRALEARASAAVSGAAMSAFAPSGRPERAGHPVVELPDGTGRDAAVLCALFEEEGRVEVVLTRRAASLRSHTGEVALPGGRVEQGETPASGALREAYEEVGIEPGQVELVGQLSALVSYRRSGRPAPITPFVGLLPGRPHLRANPAEVARAFSVALEELASPATYHSEIWTDSEGTERLMHFFDLEGDTVWGATARILDELLDVATQSG